MAEKKRARRAHKHRNEDAAPTEAHDHETPSVEGEVELARLADLESDLHADEEADAPAEADADESTDKGEEVAGHKVTRRALMDRLFSKSEHISRLSKENRELEARCKDANDKWLRSVAEFENYRKRTRKEWDLLRQQAKAEIILEILNVVDDFERAFAVEESGESNGFVAGFRLIYNNLIAVLERAGVKEFTALNEPFDPKYHMAMGQVEREDLASGLVAEVVQKGYHLDGTVIRPANVLVAK